MDSEIRSLPVLWHRDPGATTGIGFAMENVWSRQARRKRQQQVLTVQTKIEGEHGDEVGGSHESFDEEEAMLGFKVLVKQTGAQNVEVRIRWTKGNDAVLFESFCGMLKRKVGGR